MFKMSSRSIRLLVIALGAALFWNVAAQAEEWRPPTVEYTGVMTTETRGDRISARIYRGKERMRIEMETQQGPTAMIINQAERTAYMVLTRQRMYMEVPMQQAERGPIGELDQNVELEAVGQEEVNGVDTTKYRVSRKDSSQDGFEGFAWLTEERIAVRMEGTDHRDGRANPVSMNLTDLQVGDLEDRLFQVPEGYQSLGGQR